MKVQVTDDNGAVSTLVPEPDGKGRHAVFLQSLRALICPGTVNVVCGSPRVTGNNTAFTATFIRGDMISVGARFCNVTEVTDDSSLLVDEPLPVSMGNVHYGVSASDFAINAGVL